MPCIINPGVSVTIAKIKGLTRTIKELSTTQEEPKQQNLMKKSGQIIDADLELQIIATGMHLSPNFGLTYRQIEKDSFKIDKKMKKQIDNMIDSIGKGQT